MAENCDRTGMNKTVFASMTENLPNFSLDLGSYTNK